MENEELEQLKIEWTQLLSALTETLGKAPADLNSILFLIGIQELGKGPVHFSKEEKQDLIHIATCKILSYSNYYELEGLDKEGWPHWKLIKKIPSMDLLAQEQLMRWHVVQYFKHESDLLD
ncbi:hypothetical protein EI427_18750 [Flammeovirga pectinis]|uniref:Uncharacterized protein n=1 Tax=Flammeovirga pectinis TaxID=2494373 RepID=A0A3S9P7L8_9BACT|nr:hypothetical protein [Flammeovirga pectinis]AZQ64191.1 hypothetical protein EI427_18750 [Flammeovirga pectinis]